MNPDELRRLAKSQDAIAMSAKATAERLRQLAMEAENPPLRFLEYANPESLEAQSKAS